jgi:hypothetical protein
VKRSPTAEASGWKLPNIATSSPRYGVDEKLTVLASQWFRARRSSCEFPYPRIEGGHVEEVAMTATAAA